MSVQKFWGSRFDKDSDSLADEFSYSISYDSRLAVYDVMASIAHARMLGDCKIIPLKDSRALLKGLKDILREIESGKFQADPGAEDIHTQIQDLLHKKIGDPSYRLHTARSRNDLVVTDVRMYCREMGDQITADLTDLQKALVDCAEKYSDVIMPAYTHLQKAQLVLFSHHILAYISMIERDKGRLRDSLKRMNELPLGSCALSGTSLPIDRKAVASELGFAAVSKNSIDAVSDRDFVIEFTFALATATMHFSRIAEDLILWSSSEFNFVEIDSAFCTGSSIMPHKRNPDMCELIRGEAGGIFSSLQELLILMKGTPLTYNRDFQLDKPPLFRSVGKVVLMTRLLTGIFTTLKIKADPIRSAIASESFYSVDIMEYLIRKGVSYRKAHDIVGTMIRECVDLDIPIQSLNREQLKEFSPKFEEDVKTLLNPAMSVKIKSSEGSTSPRSVRRQIRHWKKLLK